MSGSALDVKKCEVGCLQDRSFTFILKTPPASVLLAKAAGVPKGSGNPKAQKVGKITEAQLKVGVLAPTCKTWRTLSEQHLHAAIQVCYTVLAA